MKKKGRDKILLRKLSTFSEKCISDNGYENSLSLKKIKYFWKGTNSNYPFGYKKLYQSSKDFIEEVLDLSGKKLLNNLN